MEKISINNSLLFAILALVIYVCAISCSTKAKEVVIEREDSPLVLIPVNDNAIRVQIKGETAHQLDELVYVNAAKNVQYDYKVSDKEAVLKLPKITAVYDFETDALTFEDKDGNAILSEKANGRTLIPSEVQGEATTEAAQTFHSPEDEALFGTGQFQDGNLNVRGLSRRLTQVNTQISVPFVVSNKGYGLLWNNYGLTDFNPGNETIMLVPLSGEGEEMAVDITTTTGNARELRKINAFGGKIELADSGQYSIMLDVGRNMARKHKVIIDDSVYVEVNNLWLPPTTSFMATFDKGVHTVIVEGEENDHPSITWRKVNDETQWRSPVSSGIDYTVFAGNPEEAIASYREVSGHSPMLPLWAFGYIHCRERYNTQAELLDNAQEFRMRNIPIDVIVQDWQYWGKYGWNAMKFDEEKYPDPTEMVKTLHDQNIKIMLSVWAKLDVNSEVGAQANEKGYLIPGSEWVDFFNPQAADFYWENSSTRLLKAHGIDAWWQDATEPENDDLKGRRIANGTLPGEVYRNAFPLFVNNTVYNGLRRDNPDNRVMIMTRSGFPGIQRYAVATWSGDVGHDLPTLKRQIIGGLGQMASGLPWWTYDAGGFFRPGNQYEDESYHNVFLRWLQCATFLPLMRVHGYMSNTEPWRYGEKVDSLSRKYIDLRYKLLPYTYACASKVSNAGSTLMRPLIFDFYNDDEALKQSCQFMYGPSILVSPVTENLGEVTNTYLPAGHRWIDFWTGETHVGGTYVNEMVPIDKIPLYVKAGSIIPMANAKQYAFDKMDEPLEIRIYAGANGAFDFYEDDGQTYECEKGAYSIIPIEWNDKERILTFGSCKGEYTGMPKTRKFIVTTHDGAKQEIAYDGNPTTIIL